MTESCDATCASVGEQCDFAHLNLDSNDRDVFDIFDVYLTFDISLTYIRDSNLPDSPAQALKFDFKDSDVLFCASTHSVFVVQLQEGHSRLTARDTDSFRTSVFSIDAKLMLRSSAMPVLYVDYEVAYFIKTSGQLWFQSVTICHDLGPRPVSTSDCNAM